MAGQVVAKYEIRQEVTEPRECWPVRYLRTITITVENFYGYDQECQSEIWYRNGQMVNSMYYPAGTDYAKKRLEGMTQVAI